jgi:PAS domain S-box-containing protein
MENTTQAPLAAAVESAAPEERLRAVAYAASGLLGARTHAELDRVLREACARVVPHDAFTFGSYHPEENALHFAVWWDGDRYEPGGAVSIEGRPSEAVVRERRSVLTHHAGEPGSVGALLFGTDRRSESIIRTPILAGDRVLGVISVQSYTTGLYTAQDVELLEAFAAVAAPALENIELLGAMGAAHEALRESEEKFRQLAENIHEIFWMFDPGFTEVLFVSPMYEEVWGRTLESLDEDPDSFVRSVHPEDRDALLHAMARVGGGEPAKVEYRVVRPDGTLRRVCSRGFPVRDEAGRVYRVVGTTEDITERRQLEEQLRQAQKMEAVGRLAGGVAHDFNNLLTAIRGHTHLVRQVTAADDAVQEDLEVIASAVDRATALTSQLLAFSRRQVLQPTTVNLNETVAETERMLRRTIGAHIELVTELDPALGAIRADPCQLSQVVLNLAVNARDAMPDGGRLLLRTSQLETGEGAGIAPGAPMSGPWVRLEVADTGCGMDEETRARVFEPFFTTKGPGEGTGLGLSTVYGIVQQAGGWIRFHSEPGRGTTFVVGLPCTDDLPAVSAPPATDARGGRETVLVAEDDPLVRGLVRSVLRRGGYQVLEAATAAEALALHEASETPVHLLLTDVGMPGMSGRALAERISAGSAPPPILFMSGYTEEAVVRHGVRVGQHVLRKPFAPEDLLLRVREVLDERG